MSNPLVFVCFVLTNGPVSLGKLRHVVIEHPAPINTPEAISDLIQAVEEKAGPGGWSREDYLSAITLVSWCRLETPPPPGEDQGRT